MKHSLPLLLLAIAVLACAPSSKVRTGSSPPPKALANTPWAMFGHDLQHTRRSEYSGPASPKAKWTFVTGGYVGSSAAIGADGTIYIGSRDKNLYAINPDGSKKWEFATRDDVKSSPAIAADGTIYVGSVDKKLYAINADGSKKWEFDAGDERSPVGAPRVRQVDHRRGMLPRHRQRVMDPRSAVPA